MSTTPSEKPDAGAKYDEQITSTYTVGEVHAMVAHMVGMQPDQIQAVAMVIMVQDEQGNPVSIAFGGSADVEGTEALVKLGAMEILGKQYGF